MEEVDFFPMFEIKLEFTRRFPVNTQFCMLAGFFFFFYSKRNYHSTHMERVIPRPKIYKVS